MTYRWRRFGVEGTAECERIPTELLDDDWCPYAPPDGDYLDLQIAGKWHRAGIRDGFVFWRPVT